MSPCRPRSSLRRASAFRGRGRFARHPAARAIAPDRTAPRRSGSRENRSAHVRAGARPARALAQTARQATERHRWRYAAATPPPVAQQAHECNRDGARPERTRLSSQPGAASLPARIAAASADPPAHRDRLGRRDRSAPRMTAWARPRQVAPRHAEPSPASHREPRIPDRRPADPGGSVTTTPRRRRSRCSSRPKRANSPSRPTTSGSGNDIRTEPFERRGGLRAIPSSPTIAGIPGTSTGCCHGARSRHSQTSFVGRPCVLLDARRTREFRWGERRRELTCQPALATRARALRGLRVHEQTERRGDGDQAKLASAVAS